MTPDEAAAARHALLATRHDALIAVEALSRDLEAIRQASTDANADDEHDPEGSTVVFERAQLAALLDAVRRDLGEIDNALGRVDTGTYGRCEVCGAPIAPERLLARPAARQCVACARTPRAR